MARVPDFHSVNEVLKPAHLRRYHNNDTCAPGRDIPSWERNAGSNGYPLCEHCFQATNLGK